MAKERIESETQETPEEEKENLRKLSQLFDCFTSWWPTGQYHHTHNLDGLAVDTLFESIGDLLSQLG